MNSLSQWDQNLLRAEMSIAELLTDLSKKPDPLVSSATIEDRNQIDVLLAQIAIEVDKIVLASKKSQSGNRSNAAIGWWTKNVAIKIKSLAQNYVALQNRKMWLRLLQSRFAASTQSKNIDLQAKHLVNLALRKRQLEELEKSLKADLEKIAKDREYLKHEYESIGTADENWSASGSFQARLGINLQHAKENPSARAFSDCLSTLSVPLIHPEENKWLRKINADLLKTSGELAEQCKEIAGAIAEGEKSAEKMGINKFQTTMEQVYAMNEQVRRKIAALRSRPKQHSRPKLVQKIEKDDRTEAHP